MGLRRPTVVTTALALATMAIADIHPPAIEVALPLLRRSNRIRLRRDPGEDLRRRSDEISLKRSAMCCWSS